MPFKILDEFFLQSVYPRDMSCSEMMIDSQHIYQLLDKRVFEVSSSIAYKASKRTEGTSPALCAEDSLLILAKSRITNHYE